MEIFLLFIFLESIWLNIFFLEIGFYFCCLWDVVVVGGGRRHTLTHTQNSLWYIFIENFHLNRDKIDFYEHLARVKERKTLRLHQLEFPIECALGEKWFEFFLQCLLYWWMLTCLVYLSLSFFWDPIIWYSVEWNGSVFPGQKKTIGIIFRILVSFWFILFNFKNLFFIKCLRILCLLLKNYIIHV